MLGRKSACVGGGGVLFNKSKKDRIKDKIQDYLLHHRGDDFKTAGSDRKFAIKPACFHLTTK